MSLSYAAEKFSLAIDAMATSPQSLQQRVGDAYADHIMHVQESDLPEDMRAQFRDLGRRLTSTEDTSGRGIGTIQATVNTMSDDEAIELARIISNMDGRIAFLNDE